MKDCRRFLAKVTFGANDKDGEDGDTYWLKGETLVEVMPGSGHIRKETVGEGTAGFPIDLLIENGVFKDYLEEITPIPFNQTKNWNTYNTNMKAELLEIDEALVVLKARKKELLSLSEMTEGEDK